MRAALVLILLAAAGGARAEGPGVRFEASAPVPQIRLPSGVIQPRSGDLFTRTTADDAPPAIPKGTVKTSLEHRFSTSGEVIGSLGYLCGLQPGRNAAGAVRTANETEGTFLGGQLKVAF